MNILIRIENRQDIARIEESLASLPVDLYFVRDDNHMLSILEQSSFDAILLGFSTDRNAVSHSIRRLKEHYIGASIPVIHCDNEGCTVSNYLDDLSSDFEQFRCAIERCYKVEVLWQSRGRSRSAYSELTC